MKITVRDLSFAYAEQKIHGKYLFNHFNADLDGGESGRPLVILGSSGCGKTTLLKILGGLLQPQGGEIHFSVEESSGAAVAPAFMFQEPRLLPWLTVRQNVSLPLEKRYGKEEAKERARHFLSLVSLDDKEEAYPSELSGGQAQRVSMARAFAWPSAALFMDEPFQSLDIPLRIHLMDLCLSLQESENLSQKNRLLIAVTHDPREAVYMGGRVIVLGEAGEGIVFDRIINLGPDERVYGNAAAGELERELIRSLSII